MYFTFGFYLTLMSAVLKKKFIVMKRQAQLCLSNFIKYIENHKASFSLQLIIHFFFKESDLYGVLIYTSPFWPLVWFQIDAVFTYPFLATFLAKGHEVNKYDTSSLKIITCAGDTLSWDIKERVKNRLQCEFYDYYGMTETGLIISKGLVASPKKNVTGHLVPGLMVKVCNGRPRFQSHFTSWFNSR